MNPLVKKKLIRTSTIAMSLDFLLKGQLGFLNQPYEVIAVSGKDHHLNNVQNRERVKTVAVTMEREISPIKDLVSLVHLYLLFKKEKPLIVHSITPKAGLLSMMAAYLAGVPIRMHTFTGLIFTSKTGYLQQLLIKIDQLLCRCATNIYPEGEGVKQDLMSYNITKKPLKIIANGNVNGIDTSYFSPEAITTEEKEALKKQLGINPSEFVYVFVGRFVGDKGMNELVLAFKQVESQKSKVVRSDETKIVGQINSKFKIQDSKLLLVGYFESDLDPLQHQTLRDIANNPNIINVGFQKDVRPYLAISDCLVFPSYREGFPNVVMQAGAMGLPSIVTNINGCNEIIIEGENGTIIPTKNSEALVTAMQRIKEDSEYRNHLCTNARPMITSRYEQSLVWEAILTEYKRLESNV